MSRAPSILDLAAADVMTARRSRYPPSLLAVEP